MKNNPNKWFENKVALVTGAASGIGRATAVEFAKQGAKVIIADVSKSKGMKTKEMIENIGGFADYIHCDVSKNHDVKKLIDEIVDKYEHLDCAFNNAGIEGDEGLTAECTEENWNKIIDTNLKGVWLCMKYEIKQMLTQGGGAIVNCSSIGGLVGFPEIAAYTASKHGVLGLTKTAALEYIKSNIRINAVCPGVIQTPMLEKSIEKDPKSKEELIETEPTKRMGQPEEVAAAVLWLCSKQASFVVGHPLAVDGGWVAQ